MRIYTIHLPPPYSARGHEPLAIREGFNWWALLFSGLWAFANRMWLAGIAMLLVPAAVAAGLDYAGAAEIFSTVVTLAVAVYIGAAANDWQRAHLARKGWKETRVIAAADRDSALRRYLDFAAIGAA